MPRDATPDRTWWAITTEVNVKGQFFVKPRLNEHISIHTKARGHFLQRVKILRHIFPLNL
ncbi:hypothetical protein GEA64_09195 [Photorhabdus khanii]|uniref:Uncharacterized protein n=1 Tax=Photorhabdus khanii TaxID=1004150 RepID=A0A7C9GIW7_9GAMM|nr:hypothetical protein [Photorhabdus khanii]